MLPNRQIGITPAQVFAAGKDSGGFISQAIGAGLLNEFRSNVQHPFDRIFFRNTANLAGQELTMFQVPIAGTYNVLNGAGTQITKTAEDTNWDQANQAQYSYLLTGMYLKFQTLEPLSFAAAPNDLTTWPDLLRMLVEDSSVKIVMEDNVMMRQKAVHVPEGNAVYGAVSATGTNATPVSQSIVSNGFSSVSNIFGFGNMALWVPKGSRFNTVVKFGPSLLTAAMAYKPVANNIFCEVRYQGVKFQAAS